jgi:hypothetical protein
MAIEEDLKDRESWTNISRYWYYRAADKIPTEGRLYHHIALTNLGDLLQEVYLFSRSLTSAQPFASTRETIQPLIKRAIQNKIDGLPKVDIAFITVHASLCVRDPVFSAALLDFHDLLEHQINTLSTEWQECGVYIASSNIGAMFDFGQRNHMTQLFEISNFLNATLESNTEQDTEQKPLIELDDEAKEEFRLACQLFFGTFRIILQRPYDNNTQPFLYVTLCFLQTLLSFRRYTDQIPKPSQDVLDVFLECTPWQLIASYGNTLIKRDNFGSRFETLEFLKPETGKAKYCPEDYSIRGMLWTQDYYPENYFANAAPLEERSIELPSTIRVRTERILNLIYKIAKQNVSL